MKFFLFILTFFSIFSSVQTVASAEEKLFYYAKILNENAYFYQSCNENNKLFQIPTSYFVILTDSANETFYSAKYGDCVGYVKKADVTPMNGTPTNPFSTFHNFRITSMSGLPLMAKASFDSEKIYSLDFLEDEIYFYGNLQGQEYFPNSTDIWHYCKILKNNETLHGYLFSYYCDFESPLPKNEEYFEEITETLSFTKPSPSSPGLSDTITAIIILSVVIPVLIISYFIIAPKKPKEKAKKIIKRHKDYYELSESDLN